MERIKSLIKEILSTPPKKNTCNCGCHSCENVGNGGPVINENLNARVIMSEDMKYHVTNKLPLTESHLPYGSEAFLNLWAEARYLYSREVIHVNDKDKKILVETNLGEYGMYKGKKVPLDLQLLEDKIGTKNDIDLEKGRLLPYNELLNQIEDDYGKGDEYYEIEQAIFDKNFEELYNILKRYKMLNKYLHLLNLNESYKFIRNKGKVLKQMLNENSAEKLYKIEGLLVTNNDLLFQKELLSDIRSITGITTVDAKEYIPRLPKANYSYNKLTVKVDPYPYLKDGKFDIETIKRVIQDINNIRGVIKFRVDNPQIINVGV